MKEYKLRHSMNLINEIWLFSAQFLKKNVFEIEPFLRNRGNFFSEIVKF